MPSKKKTPTRTFTMPESDSALIKEIQSRCRKHDLSLNDCEVVRAGIAALLNLPDKQFLQTVKSLAKLKRGKQPEGGE
jgi:hypothetical protein